jgi:hypothetical protein
MLASLSGLPYYQLINMTTSAQNVKNAVAKFCLGLLFLLGSFSLCQAQSSFGSHDFSGLQLSAITPSQSSAPVLDGWTPPAGGSYLVVSSLNSENVPNILFPVNAPDPSATAQGVSPAILPEPSTFGLLLAGSAAALRFGWRKRSA